MNPLHQTLSIHGSMKSGRKYTIVNGRKQIQQNNGVDTM